MAIDAAASTSANTSARAGVIWPTTIGRHEVRAIFASMRESSSWLIAAALEAASQMPKKPSAALRASVAPGTPSIAIRLPTSAVNTINATTRGLVRLQYWRSTSRSVLPRAQPRQQADQHEQQQRGAGVVHHRHRQRQRQLDVGDAQRDLGQQQHHEQ